MADLVERYTAEVTLGGETRRVDWSRTTTSLTKMYDQIIEVDTTFRAILTISTTEVGGTIPGPNVFLIENLEASAEITLNVVGPTAGLTLPAGSIYRYEGVNTGDDTDLTGVQAKVASGTGKLRVVAFDDS